MDTNIYFLILEMKNIVIKFKNSIVTKISMLVTVRELVIERTHYRIHPEYSQSTKRSKE